MSTPDAPDSANAVLPASALTMLALGWYGMRKARNRNDFLVAGRRLGPGLYLGTMAAGVLGGASTIGTVNRLSSWIHESSEVIPDCR
ncbi:MULTISPECIES: hypothetical protein [Burkholderia]|uniref:hypothetical protein n=1 Tax=Burkholderia TaxID=32008 RepID=UPI001F3C7049|nr:MULTISPECIES: hypothetical protein [Burkholderia]